MENKSLFLPAEWHPQTAIQLTWPSTESDWAGHLTEARACVRQMIEIITRYQKVLLVHSDAIDRAAVFPDISEERLQLAHLPTNDTWCRDYGPITVLENGQPQLLDFQFNGWGLKFPADQDNQVTKRLHEKGFLGNIPIDSKALVLEGGSIESDGAGTLLTTSTCLLSPNRNPTYGKEALEKKFRELFGTERVLWLDHGHLLGDDTDAHIDTLARFCNPTTIAYVQCSDPADPHHAGLQKMEQQLQSFRRPNGQPYTLIPLPLPQPLYATDGHRLPATYANFLILNGAVLVPTYGVAQDKSALKILKKIFPDREVIGIDCRVLVEQHGSLHCMTMQLL